MSERLPETETLRQVREQALARIEEAETHAEQAEALARERGKRQAAYALLLGRWLSLGVNVNGIRPLELDRETREALGEHPPLSPNLVVCTASERGSECEDARSWFEMWREAEEELEKFRVKLADVERKLAERNEVIDYYGKWLDMAANWPREANLSEVIGGWDQARDKDRLFKALGGDAVLATLVGAAEAFASECICRDIIERDERRHFRECPLRAKYPDVPVPRDTRG